MPNPDAPHAVSSTSGSEIQGSGIDSGGLDGIDSARRLVAEVRSRPLHPWHQLVLGAAGTGKSATLTEVRRALREAEVPISDSPESDDVGAILVDDAHALDDAGLRHLTAVADSGRRTVVVAAEPRPSRPALRRLMERLHGERGVLQLGPLPRAGVHQRAAARLGAEPSPWLLDLLVDATAGAPDLLDAALAGLGPLAPLNRAEDPAATSTIADAVTRRLADRLDRLDGDLLWTLAAALTGAGLDPEELAEGLGTDIPRASGLIDAARGTGLLGTADTVRLMARESVAAAVGENRLSTARQTVLVSRLRRGQLRLPLARKLARAGLRDPQLARYLVTAADAELGDRPAEAGEIYIEALGVGAEAGALATRRAEASVRSGDLTTAMTIADEAWGQVDDASVPTLTRVAATVSVMRGMSQHGAALYRYLGPERAGVEASLASVVLWGAGDRDAAQTMLAARAGGPPTALSAGLSLLADGVAQSMGADSAVAMNTLARAASLLHTADRSLLTPDSGAAIAALAALHSGDLHRAETVLRRALQAEPTQSVTRTRHLALLAWTAMLRGDLVAAGELRDSAVSLASVQYRDELFLGALRVGIARRSSDFGALSMAWADVQEVVGEHSPDLFTLLPLGELWVAAARMNDTVRMQPLMTEAHDLLERLGEPVLWSSALHWAGVHGAILTRQPTDLMPHAAALSAASHHSPYAAALAAGGQAWLRVLSGRVEADEVEQAARTLTRFGLSWDGSRLAGQAALYAESGSVATALLHVARQLQQSGVATTDPTPDTARTTAQSAPSLLSDREREVATLVTMGLTYRDIGAQLYISAKTVEHHVARMRGRLGASSRRELLSMLRAMELAGPSEDIPVDGAVPAAQRMSASWTRGPGR